MTTTEIQLVLYKINEFSIISDYGSFVILKGRKVVWEEYSLMCAIIWCCVNTALPISLNRTLSLLREQYIKENKNV